MVSVIIDACNSHKFLIRSLNSVRRQTYNDIEIIVVAKEKIENLLRNDVKIVVAQNFCEGIAKSVASAGGEHIYFCSSTSVLTDNVISDLVEAASDSSLGIYTKTYIKAQEDCSEYRGANASLYGKLVAKDKFKNTLSGNYSSQAEIVISYMKQCKGVLSADSAIMYESCTDSEICEAAVKNTKEEALKTLLKEVNDAEMSVAVRNYITAGIGEFIATSVEDAENIMNYISSAMPNDMWLNYAVSRKTISRWWNIIQNGNSAKIYSKFIDYVSSFDDELTKVILNGCGINRAIFEIMKANEQSVFLNIYNSIEKDSEVVAVRTVATTKNNAQQYSYELSGMQLADFVVEKYRNGSLGLKTFFKSIGAWIKYKLKR